MITRLAIIVIVALTTLISSPLAVAGTCKGDADCKVCVNCGKCAWCNSGKRPTCGKQQAKDRIGDKLRDWLNDRIKSILH